MSSGEASARASHSPRAIGVFGASRRLRFLHVKLHHWLIKGKSRCWNAGDLKFVMQIPASNASSSQLRSVGSAAEGSHERLPSPLHSINQLASRLSHPSAERLLGWPAHSTTGCFSSPWRMLLLCCAARLDLRIIQCASRRLLCAAASCILAWHICCCCCGLSVVWQRSLCLM